MKAIIQSAVDSGRSFPDKTTGNPIHVYEVVAGGVMYDCMNAKVLELLGKEVEFNVQLSPNPKYHSKMFLPKEGGSSWGAKKPFVPAFKDTREGFIVSQRGYVLSYAERIANTYATVQCPKSFTEVLDNVEEAFKRLLPIMELEKIPAVPVPAQNVHIQTQTHVEYHLKPVLETILKGKFKANNFTNRDIVEYCGNFGVMIPNDPNSGDVYINKLSEADANLLINELNRA